MIEAGARALFNLDRQAGRDWWSGATPAQRGLYEAKFAAALAAALGVCDVREEWGTKIWVDGGEDEAQDDFFAGSCREIAQDRVRLHVERRAANPPEEQVTARRWHGNARLIRRLSITTPAEPVDTEGAQTP
jgi:hypothetical protein